MMKSEETNNFQSDLEALRAGQASALRRIFDAHYPLMVATVQRMGLDEALSKDLAQDVFVELWGKRESLEIHSSLQAYLRRAATNKALNYIRQQKRLNFEAPEGLERLPDPSQQEQGDQLRQENLEMALDGAIEALPEKCRLIFRLSRYEEMSHKEIAQSLDISTKTIENQITKALKLIRKALQESGHLSPIVIWLINLWLSS